MDRTSVNISKAALAKFTQIKREMSHRDQVDLTADDVLWKLMRHWDATKPVQATT